MFHPAGAISECGSGRIVLPDLRVRYPPPLGLAILVSAFLIFPLNERATNAKQVQLMTGLLPGVFWISNLVWDFLLYALAAFIMFGIILGLDNNGTFLNYGAWGALALIILLLGWFGIPFSYAFSFLANNAAAGFAFLIIVNILAGCIAPTMVFVLRDYGTQFESDVLIESADAVQWIFYWFPIFPFTRALMAIITVGVMILNCNSHSCLVPQFLRCRREIICARLELREKLWNWSVRNITRLVREM